MKQDNSYLRSLLLEPKVSVRQEVKSESLVPIGGLKTWHNTRKDLTKRSIVQKHKDENPVPLESIEI